jgi:transposase InsO family protein
MSMTTKAQADIRRKLKVLNHVKETGNVSKTCRYFGISRETYYKWKRDYESKGESALINSKPCPQNPKIRIPADIEEKILHLRKTYYLNQLRISWYLKRYHGIKVSQGGVWCVLKRNGVNRLPQNQRKRSMEQFKRYEKQVPGHRIQVDVKFLFFNDKSGKRIKRYQYTAIDDASRARALRIYRKHNQKCAIEFLDYVRTEFPFRIHTVQTDNGHEFQALFHWHCEDLGIRHVYIKKASPHLNGKVERSHLTDQQEFYQLLEYKGDIDIGKKLRQWEIFYNCHRPNAALNGKTPYEVLREKLVSTYFFS